MGLINGVPNFAAAANLSAADLNTTTKKFVEQLGGYDADGVHYPGNLELVNHSATPGFRNDHKLEAYAAFSVSVPTIIPGAVDDLARLIGRSIGPMPLACSLVGATLAAEGAGFTLSKAGLLIFVDGVQMVELEATAERSWPVSLAIAAGAVLRVETHGVTYSAGAATELRATLWLKAIHKG